MKSVLKISTCSITSITPRPR